MLIKEPENVANRCILRAYNAATRDSVRGWFTRWGLKRFPDPLAGLRGRFVAFTRGDGEEWEESGGEG